MASPYLILALLATFTFSAATQIVVWRESSVHQQTTPGGILEALMGDSRRLFANHFLTKADVYLHGGVYPSIFDQAQRERRSHLTHASDVSVPHTEHHPFDATSDAHPDGEGHADHDAVTGLIQKPRDWIDAFGRNFYPTRHVHLATKQEQSEILPWLKLAADLNPNEVETYTVGAYWLRQRMGKVKEAEQFLREGWRANPESFEILFELARLNEENHRDDLRARNLFELALRKWAASEPGKEKPDELTLMQILGHLARLEQRASRMEKAIGYLDWLSKISPAPERIRQQIAALQSGAASSVH